MPRQSEEEIIARMVVDEQEPGARHAAQLLGPAPGMEDVKGQTEQDMWDYRDPAMTPQQAMQIVIQAREAGLDEDDVQGILTMKVYPNRGAMLLSVSDDPKEQARYARKMRGTPAIETTANELTPEPEAEGY